MRTFLTQQLLLQRGIDEEINGRALWDWIGQGAVDEDTSEIFCRVCNHFYNPLTNDGLWIAPANSSLNWAWHDRANFHNWQKARWAYWNWLTARSRSQRDQAAVDLFRNLGHVIHLIQDLAQPQHTRDDAHVPTLETSAFEMLCSSEYGTVPQILTLPFEPVPQFETLNSSADGSIPPEFASFWDTDQYSGSLSPGGFDHTPGLAEYSHCFFVSDDTMFWGNDDVYFAGGWHVSLDSYIPEGDFEGHAPGYFPYPRLENTNIIAALGSVQRAHLRRYGENIPGSREMTHLRYEYAGEVIDDFCALTWNGIRPNGDRDYDGLALTAQNYRSHARKLLPKAVSYSAGVLKYFFRAQLAISQHWNGARNEVRVTNVSQEPLGDGFWILLSENGDGTRLPVPGAVFNYPGSLPPGASFILTYPDGDLCTPLGTLTLAFRGTIGTERDIPGTPKFAMVARRFAPMIAAFNGVLVLPAQCNCVEQSFPIRIEIDRRRTDLVEARFIVVGITYAAPLICDGDSLTSYAWNATLLGNALEGQSNHFFCPIAPPGCVTTGYFTALRGN